MISITVHQGRMTKEIETRTTPSGTTIGRFSIAVERDRAEQDGTRKADFFNYVTFGKTAEVIAKYFHKGDMIILVGRGRNNNWTDSEGKTHYGHEYTVQTFGFCGSKGDKKNDESAGINYESVDEEDIPF